MSRDTWLKDPKTSKEVAAVIEHDGTVRPLTPAELQAREKAAAEDMAESQGVKPEAAMALHPAIGGPVHHVSAARPIGDRDDDDDRG